MDLLAITRAAWGNARSGRIISGASTIHQQLIKNTSAKTKRTLRVKLIEALQARRLAMTGPVTKYRRLPQPHFFWQ